MLAEIHDLSSSSGQNDDANQPISQTDCQTSSFDLLAGIQALQTSKFSPFKLYAEVLTPQLPQTKSSRRLEH